MDDSKKVEAMAKTVRILKYAICFILMLAMTTCVSSKKRTSHSKKNNTSHVNASQLGRNKYYYSSGYQKKLSKNYKKK